MTKRNKQHNIGMCGLWTNCSVVEENDMSAAFVVARETGYV